MFPNGETWASLRTALINPSALPTPTWAPVSSQ